MGSVLSVQLASAAARSLFYFLTWIPSLGQRINSKAIRSPMQ